MGGRGVWVVAAMRDPGAMSWNRDRGHGAGVEGMGAMEWSGRSGRRGLHGGGESGEGGAGGHGLGQGHGATGPWEGCMEGEGVWVVAAM